MLDRTIAPPIHPIIIPAIPSGEHRQLANGVPFYVVRQGVQPVVALEVLFPLNGTDQVLANLAMTMLQEGTATHTAEQIKNKLARYGAFFETSAGLENGSLSIYTLERFLPALLPLIVEMLTLATFPEAEWHTRQQQSIQNLAVNREKTGYLANEAFMSALFSGHPYGEPLTEAKLTATTAQALHTTYYSQMRMQLPIVVMSGQFGDALVAEVEQALDQAFTGRASQLLDALAPMPRGGTQHVHKAEATQVSLRMGRRLFSRHHAHYFATRMLVEIFGGYFGSRLMKNIREEKGLTYGIRAGVVPLSVDGYLSIGTDVNAENYQLALDEIAIEMRRLQTEPVPEEELALVRNYMKGSFANDLGTAFATAEKLKTRLLYNLPDDYYQQYIHAIDTTTAEQLQQMANLYLRPEDMVIIAAGAV